MCGIGGWLGAVADGSLAADTMVRSLRHRGPDAHGIKAWAHATLLHTRLSIIDLSPAGAQPMPDETGNLWVTFNGEIYNHRELRKPLESRGHRFRSRSDTEVLGHLYQEEGPSFVSRLRGMFAFAIHDVKARTLFLARDRFGIKPLYYTHSGDRFAFASEIGALLDIPGIDRTPDPQAIHDFAALGYIPAPLTFYKGIRSLEPGGTVLAKLEGNRVSCRITRFHHWEIAPDPDLTLETAATRAEELISAAVSRELESDVPLGSLLSGGIDSSLISLAAQKMLEGDLRTFNVRFSDKRFDESWAAELVAKHIGSHHETLDMDSVHGSWDHVTGLLTRAGQPFADTSLFAVNAICRLMRQHVTVAISGDGGDEAFGGYDIYWRLARIAQWQALPSGLRKGASLAMRPLSALGVVQPHLSERIRLMEDADDTAVLASLFYLVHENEHKELVRNTGQLPVRRLFERGWTHTFPRGTPRVERLSAGATELSTRMLLPNDFLFKVDMASMQESLEVRVPMLDEDLYAFGLTLPQRLKVEGRTCKRTLRAVASRQLPEGVANKGKWGFSVPLETWFGADFKQNLRDVLLGSSSRLPEFFRREYYVPMIEAFCAGNSFGTIAREELYPRAVMLLSVQLALSRS